MSMIFKCKCMLYYNQKTTGVWLMSGLDYSIHDSLGAYLHHKGLNRVRYMLVNGEEYFKLDEIEDESKYWVEVKRRRVDIKYGFKRGNR